jgi:hypothetical protein
MPDSGFFRTADECPQALHERGMRAFSFCRRKGIDSFASIWYIVHDNDNQYQ